jgi:hypothetical protein
VLDYPGKRVGLLDGGLPPREKGKAVPLGFQVDSAGRRSTHFARITAKIDGDSLDFLFDTGATTTITGTAAAYVGSSRELDFGTSFIVDSIARVWRARHSDWRWVDSAEVDTRAAMIRVPSIEIGGLTAGPVWFTVRPNAAFHQYMTQWMDRRIEGALGGSALKYFRVTLDYPRATAFFERL